MINNTSKRVDLHTHSTASDGTFSPSELAHEAAKAGLSACAITDHDTVSGTDEFIKECDKLGIEGIPGVEISAEYPTEMHIVGLFMDCNNEAFRKKLYSLEHGRELRNRKMIELCCRSGMYITAEDILAEKDDNSFDNAGRPHFAKALIKKGYVSSINEAFEKYLAKGKKCYCERSRYSPKDSIRLIKDAGGITILAHPIFISRDENVLYNILKELKSYGLDGAECIYTEYDQAFSELCFSLCRRLELISSGGSDFHGANKTGIMLGSGRGNLNIPYEFVEKMKQLKG